MSTNATHLRSWPVRIAADGERRHRILIGLAIASALIFLSGIALYGWGYYILVPAERPLSPLHSRMKPSGSIGLKLGFLGFFLFVLVYLYPLRKRWPWLSRKGKSQHWLDFHMLLGLIAPAVICFHSAFKTQGFAGMAFWTMLALAASGLVGRYFYAQIPRSLDAVELSLKETENRLARFKAAMEVQRVFDPEEIKRIFHVPEMEQAGKMPVWRAILTMIALDLERPLKVWGLRRRRNSFRVRVLSFGGILPSQDRELEEVITLAAKQASLAKRAVFLAKTERIFHLWHVVHRPFSVSFALFVIIHVVVVMALGYF
jgi:hypothetical protein